MTLADEYAAHHPTALEVLCDHTARIDHRGGAWRVEKPRRIDVRGIEVTTP